MPILLIGLVFLVTPWLFPVSSCSRRVFFLFEVGLVVSLQAFIFTTLSAIYIGGAIEPEH